MLTIWQVNPVVAIGSEQVVSLSSKKMVTSHCSASVIPTSQNTLHCCSIHPVTLRNRLVGNTSTCGGGGNWNWTCNFQIPRWQLFPSSNCCLKMSPFVPVCFRYSHCAHVFGDKLIVVGGVWMQSDGVPGVVIISLSTYSSMEFRLDTVSFHSATVWGKWKYTPPFGGVFIPDNPV